jgi:hypothetical protein
VTQKGRNADSFVLICSRTGIKIVEVPSENFSFFKCHIRSHCSRFQMSHPVTLHLFRRDPHLPRQLW